MPVKLRQIFPRLVDKVEQPITSLGEENKCPKNKSLDYRSSVNINQRSVQIMDYFERLSTIMTEWVETSFLTRLHPRANKPLLSYESQSQPPRNHVVYDRGA